MTEGLAEEAKAERGYRGGTPISLMVGVGLSGAMYQEAGKIDVTVKKGNGDPADGWTVEVTQLSGGSYHNSLLVDADGHVLFEGCPSGQYRVEAYKKPKFLYGGASTDQVFVTAPETAFVELTLAGGLARSQQSQQSLPLSR